MGRSNIGRRGRRRSPADDSLGGALSLRAVNQREKMVCAVSLDYQAQVRRKKTNREVMDNRCEFLKLLCEADSDC